MTHYWLHVEENLNRTWVEHAQVYINYFQPLVEQPGGQYWALGLFMAKQWLRLLQQSEHDLEELRLFATVLEAEQNKEGCAWSDMCYRIGTWVKEVEAAAEQGN